MRRAISLMLSLLFLLTPCLTLAESADDLASDLMDEAIIDFLRAALDSEPELNYEYDEMSATFSLLIESTGGEMGDLYTYIDVYENGVLLQVCYETDAPEDRLSELLRFINLVNADLLGSKFYIYEETGYIFCETYLEFALVDPGALTASAQSAFLDCLYDLLTEANFDAMYFAEILAGETGVNAFAMYFADLAF